MSLGIRNTIETAQGIIIATAILHNIAKDRNDILPDIQDIQEHILENIDGQERNEDINYRQPFLEYFEHLL